MGEGRSSASAFAHNMIFFVLGRRGSTPPRHLTADYVICALRESRLQCNECRMPACGHGLRMPACGHGPRGKVVNVYITASHATTLQAP
jgi:hypothetical protein